MLAAVPFFTTVIEENPESPWQQLGSLVERALYLGGAKVCVMGEEVAVRNEQVPCWELGVKIALFVFSAGIIPLALLIAKAIYRSEQTFYVEGGLEERLPPAPLTIEEIEQEIEQNRPVPGKAVQVKRDGQKYLVRVQADQTVKIQRINKILGRGTFAKVSQLLDVRTGELTALKVAKVDDVEESERQLRKEVEVVNDLHTERRLPFLLLPPLTPIFNIEKGPGSKIRLAYEAVQYVGNLEDLKKEEPPFITWISIIDQIVKGVQYLRERGYVHGDIKPQNIFYNIDPRGVYHIFIGDFGGAAKRGEPIAACSPQYTSLPDITAAGGARTSIGMHYEYKKHDIFALGTTIEELLGRFSIKDELRKAGIKEEKIQDFLNVLERTKIEGEHSVFKDHLSRENSRPSIEEIVKAVAGVKFEEFVVV